MSKNELFSFPPFSSFIHIKPKNHTLLFTEIISSFSFLGSAKGVTKCPTHYWYHHLPWKHSTDPHQREMQAPGQGTVSVKGERKKQADPKKPGCPWGTALCLQFWMEGDQAAQRLTTHGSCRDNVEATADIQQFVQRLISNKNATTSFPALEAVFLSLQVDAHKCITHQACGVILRNVWMHPV